MYIECHLHARHVSAEELVLNKAHVTFLFIWNFTVVINKTALDGDMY